MQRIKENIAKINGLKAAAAEKTGRSGDDILLVGVTKTRSADEINEGIDAGLTDIGENKVQEIMDKIRLCKACQMAYDWTFADKQGKIYY